MFETEIAAGIALLDEKGPDNWRNKIDFSDLDMGKNRSCILGQLYDGYWTALRLLGINDGEACFLGFNIRSSVGQEDPDYSALAQGWKEALSRPAPSDSPTFTVTADELKALVTKAMDAAPTRGDYSEIGCVYSWLTETGRI